MYKLPRFRALASERLWSLPPSIGRNGARLPYYRVVSTRSAVPKLAPSQCYTVMTSLGSNLILSWRSWLGFIITIIVTIQHAMLHFHKKTGLAVTMICVALNNNLMRRREMNTIDELVITLKSPFRVTYYRMGHIGKIYPMYYNDTIHLLIRVSSVVHRVCIEALILFKANNINQT